MKAFAPKQKSELLAERIYQLRRRAGLKQAALAQLIGTSRAAVSDWERAKRTPSPKNLYALAAVFRLSVDYLLGKDTTSLDQTVRETTKPYADTITIDTGKPPDTLIELLRPVHPDVDAKVNILLKCPHCDGEVTLRSLKVEIAKRESG